MKQKIFFSIIFMITNWNCYIKNPKYYNCNASCNKKQNLCVTDARTSEQIDKCKEYLDLCIADCEKNFQKVIRKDQ